MATATDFIADRATQFLAAQKAEQAAQAAKAEPDATPTSSPDGATNDQLCADTSISVDSYDCSTSTVTFRNTGYFNITKVKCRGEDVQFPAPLAPEKKSQPLNNCLDNTLNNIYVVPFITFNEEEIPCADKSVRIVC